MTRINSFLQCWLLLLLFLIGPGAVLAAAAAADTETNNDMIHDYCEDNATTTNMASDVVQVMENFLSPQECSFFQKHDATSYRSSNVRFRGRAPLTEQLMQRFLGDTNQKTIMSTTQDNNDDAWRSKHPTATAQITLITGTTAKHTDCPMTDDSDDIHDDETHSIVNGQEQENNAVHHHHSKDNSGITTLVFLETNLNATFWVGNNKNRGIRQNEHCSNNNHMQPIPVTQGTRVSFPSNAPHHTSVQQGTVQLLGPFDATSFQRLEMDIFLAQLIASGLWFYGPCDVDGSCRRRSLNVRNNGKNALEQCVGKKKKKVKFGKKKKGNAVSVKDIQTVWERIVDNFDFVVGVDVADYAFLLVHVLDFRPQEIEQILSQVDADANGRLTVDELQPYFPSLDYVHAALAQCQEDDYAHVPVVSLYDLMEFFTILFGTDEIVDSDKLEEAFVEAENTIGNGDGVLDIDEFKAVMGPLYI